MDLLSDIVDGDRGAGIAETAAAAVAGSRRKQGAVGSKDVEGYKPELFDQRDQSVKDLLMATFAEAGVEVREGSLARDAVLPKASRALVVLSAFGIAQDRAEMLDVRNPVEITKQV